MEACLPSRQRSSIVMSTFSFVPRQQSPSFYDMLCPEKKAQSYHHSETYMYTPLNGVHMLLSMEPVNEHSTFSSQNIYVHTQSVEEADPARSPVLYCVQNIPCNIHRLVCERQGIPENLRRPDSITRGEAASELWLSLVDWTGPPPLWKKWKKRQSTRKWREMGKMKQLAVNCNTFHGFSLSQLQSIIDITHLDWRQVINPAQQDGSCEAGKETL